MSITIHRRALAYAVVAALLLVCFLALRPLRWQGSAELHTLMEAVATILALVVGAMGLVHYYSSRACIFLLIGVGFLGTGLLDGYHAVVTSSFFARTFPSPPPSLIPWSWIASRLYLSLALWMSYLAWQRESRGGGSGRAGGANARIVYAVAALLTTASFLFFIFVPLPRAYYPELFFPRPQELIPALFFLLALIGYLRAGAWKENDFQHWLVLSLIVGFLSQAMFMSSSHGLFDMMFDAAHALKKGSYICVLTGLFISMYRSFLEERRLAGEADDQRASLHRALRELQASEAAFQAFMDHSPMVAWAKDDLLRFVYVNAPFERAFSLRLADVQGRTDLDLFPRDVARQNQENDRRALESSDQIEIVEAVPTPEGQIRHWLAIKFPYPLAGDRTGVGGVAVDITERRERELMLRELSAAVEQSPVSIVITDREGLIQYVNPRFERISGYRADEVLGRNPRILKSGHTTPEEYAALWKTILSGQVWRGEFLNVRKDGSRYWEECSISPVRSEDGKITAFVAVKEDVSARKEREEVIWARANFDHLTGLANRSLFNDRLDRALAQARRSGNLVGLLYIDLDGFKAVNDNFGHDAGDELLVQAAARLQKAVRNADTVGRMGGDEFTVLLLDLKRRDDLGMIGEKVLNELRRPFQLGDNSLLLSGSLGIAVFPGDGDDPAELLKNADSAMYEAKSAGRNILRFYRASP